MEQFIKNEIQFCEEIDAQKNEHGQFIYKSKDGISTLNLPYVLEDYKQWLIDNKIVKLVQNINY